MASNRRRLKVEDGVATMGTLDNGRVTWDSQIAFTQALKGMGNGRVLVRVDFATDQALASLKAIRYYRFALGWLAKATENDKTELHEFYRGQFLTEPHFVVNKRTGESTETTVTKSTMDLSPADLWDYTEKVRQHAAEFFGEVIPPPDPEYGRDRRSA